MRCIFPRAHAPARAINIIVHVFLLLLRMLKKICRVTYLFSSALRKKTFEKMVKKSTVPFGSQKLLTLYLEELLIHMIRRYTIAHYSASAGIYDSCQTSSETCRNIIHYLGEHVRQSLTIEDISKDNMIGRSQLQKLFREEYQCGVIEFFSRMKIDFAKQLIRENDMNFTQISDFLGYSSIHYFSRQFQKAVRHDTNRIRHIHQGII